MDPLKIPGCAEMRMPDTTWAEVLAWFAANDVDLDRCPASRDILITNTIDRWQTRRDDATGPAVYVSTPITVPLPSHLHAAIARAATGDDTGSLRTPAEWCERYGVMVIDPTGWAGQSWHTPIPEDEFVLRTSRSALREIPSVLLVDSAALESA